jgi:tripartite-type tricarboxylate transporter receptor subunit TctC
MGTPVLVENKPGANGFLASQTVAAAKPDGYTLLYTTNTTHAANAALFRALPYDPEKDFSPISRMSMGGIVLLVSAKSKHHSLDDLTRAAKAAPGKITFASGNSSSRIAAEMYAHQAGISLLHVPYKGIPQAITEVLAGIVDFVVADAANSFALASSGQMRALAVTSETRMTELPNVPTVAEAGFPGYSLYVWTAMFAPANTARPIRERLSRVIKDYFDSPAGREAVRLAGAIGSPTTPEGLAEFVRIETKKWSEAVKNAGIVAE